VPWEAKQNRSIPPKERTDFHHKMRLKEDLSDVQSQHKNLPLGPAFII